MASTVDLANEILELASFGAGNLIKVSKAHPERRMEFCSDPFSQPRLLISRKRMRHCQPKLNQIGGLLEELILADLRCNLEHGRNVR